MRKNFKNRLNILTYPKFQLTLLFGHLLVTGAVLITVYLFVRSAFSKLTRDGLDAGLTGQHPYFKFLQYQSETIMRYVFIAFFIGFLVSSLWMLLLSHRLAGPIIRLRGHFQKIRNGEAVSAIAFRKGDFFEDLPPVINDAVEMLKK